MLAPRAATKRKLKQHLRYFFDSHWRSREEVQAFADGLMELGPTVVIGGLVRDLLLSGNRPFASDIDFVLQPESLADFERAMKRMGAATNRFGGYSLPLHNWKVEVWPLERTWAAVEGFVHVKELTDLTKATFFNWDAIIYDLSSRQLLADDHYFEKVRCRYLDVNLLDNPNPLGNAVRALRYAYKWHANLGPRLADHVARQVQDNGWSVILDAEKASFSIRYLDRVDGDEVSSTLRSWDRQDSCVIVLPLGVRSRQLPLFE